MMKINLDEWQELERELHPNAPDMGIRQADEKERARETAAGRRPSTPAQNAEGEGDRAVPSTPLKGDRAVPSTPLKHFSPSELEPGTPSFGARTPVFGTEQERLSWVQDQRTKQAEEERLDWVRELGPGRMTNHLTTEGAGRGCRHD